MGLKRRSKVSAEFSMSSLTDIIFLLLIFFMLTSTLVRLQPFELPQSDTRAVAATDIVVSISRAGQYMVNNQEISGRALERILTSKVRGSENRQNATITIVAEVGTPFDRVNDIMKIAGRLRAKAIIATQPKE